MPRRGMTPVPPLEITRVQPRPKAPKSDIKQVASVMPVSNPRTYPVFAVRPIEGVVGGVLIDHKSVRITCSVVVAKIIDKQSSIIKFEISPSEGGIYTHELTVKAGQPAVADVSIKVPSCTVKILAEDACRDVYVTITAYPEGYHA